MGRSQTIFLMIVFIFWPLEQSAFLDKLELQNPMWIRVNLNNYFNRHVGPSIRPYVRPCVRTSVTKFFFA